MQNNASKKQSLANRRNAQRSTGPKTPEGKARSSRNALKHGLLAKEVLILDGDGAENRNDFDALLADLCHELKPEGVIEEALVERIATCYWRLRRAQRYEVGAIRESLDECDRPEDDSDIQAAGDVSQRLEKAQAPLADDEQLLRTLDSPPDLTDPDTVNKVQSTLKDLAADHGIRPDGLTVPQLLEAVRNAQRLLVGQRRTEIDRLQAELSSAQRYDRLRRSRRALIGSLPVQDTLIKLVRYETMLDRQIHRALTELRRRRTQTPDPGTSILSSARRHGPDLPEGSPNHPSPTRPPPRRHPHHGTKKRRFPNEAIPARPPRPPAIRTRQSTVANRQSSCRISRFRRRARPPPD